MSGLPTRTQVLVVGAGPAGSSAAIHLAQAGLEVTLVDRRRVVGVPVQCAEFLPRPMAGLAHQLNALVQPLQGMHSHSGHLSAYRVFPGVMIDRARFDQGLARRAQETGARLFLQCRLQDVSPTDRIATLRLNGATRPIRFDTLIAADGPQSRVAQCCGLPALEQVHAWQMSVPLTEATHHTRVWLDDRFPGGYAWSFPKGDLALMGFGISASKGCAAIGTSRAALRHLMNEQQRLGHIQDHLCARTAGTIAVSGLRPELVKGPVVFVGDAAGGSHPITGAGIATAVQSGELAARAVVQAWRSHHSDLSEYARDMQFLFGQTLTQAAQSRNRWMALPRSRRYQWPVLQALWPGFQAHEQRTGT